MWLIGLSGLVWFRVQGLIRKGIAHIRPPILKPDKVGVSLKDYLCLCQCLFDPKP